MLKTLNKEHEASLKKWIAGGGKVAEYQCPTCKKTIKTIQPEKNQVVKGKGFWDSVKMCPECNSGAFVRVWPSGKTEVVMVIHTALYDDTQPDERKEPRS